ncbi:DUF551 domain-containing protein [Klebsiella grimontii]|uniref:DUF551 domain-containing protein n=1 Tax=Klebsiella TaxID=570 RepID=UPI0012B905A9|nr:DUF551 domain-containing protein [Klebsiella grimontii]
MSEFSRETLLSIIETDHVQCGEASALARMVLAAMDSESGCLPLDYLQGHKDGLEWAAQLAEANHPETGDWLYDDPIELAKAIRKGPDMPPAQPVADSEQVAEITEDLGRLFVKIHHPTTLKAGDKLYRHAQQPVTHDRSIFEKWWESQNGAPLDGWDSLRATDGYCDDGIDGQFEAWSAAMLAAAPQLPGSEPATVPGKWIPVSERMPETDGNYWGWWSESKRQGPVWFIKSELQAQFQSSEITHWMPLPDAPQEVKGE